MKDSERMTKLLHALGKSAAGLAKDLGVHPTRIYHIINERNGITDRLAALISARFPQVNSSFLTKDIGGVFIGDDYSTPSLNGTSKDVHIVERDYEYGDINVETESGKEGYKIPGFLEGSLMRVRDNSMYPKYEQGDYVGFRIIDKSKGVIWGKNYIVTFGNQGLIRKVMPGENGKVRLIPLNQEYPEIEISMENIKDIAKISATVNLE